MDVNLSSAGSWVWDHASLTDPDAQSYRNSNHTPAPLCHMGHLLRENRHGLIVDVETTQATGTPQHEAGLKRFKHSARPPDHEGRPHGIWREL